MHDSNPYLKVEPDCIACSWCKYSCPVEGCITFEGGVAAINDATCIECGRCIFVCPVNVIIPLREAAPRRLGERE
jgi:NAD-dependent dihydropyrimidine dehydrogenase PreA subunit